MTFLTINDILGAIGDNTLTQLRGTDDINLNNANKMAISKLAPLRELYNISVELKKSGDNRNDELIRILVAFTAYYLYNKVEDDDIPDRIRDNFKDEDKTVAAIAVGKMGTTLIRATTGDGENINNIRFSDSKPRNTDIYW